MRTTLTVALVAAALAALGATAQAAERKTPTISIQVTDMHCAACAKKIARKLYGVAGVVQVRTDLKRHTATITPEAKRQPNPLALWKAVEAAGFEPVKLACPAGEFNTRKALVASFGTPHEQAAEAAAESPGQ